MCREQDKCVDGNQRVEKRINVWNLLAGKDNKIKRINYSLEKRINVLTEPMCREEDNKIKRINYYTSRNYSLRRG
jgi:hypothetical protein